ncbi:hypothetical protein BC830DRAFT_872184 [Chytriomyces sp. MP71]|nr:hypothetical protein BC830DRAFT_872184 [Chytriomyces sp. MP71]
MAHLAREQAASKSKLKGGERESDWFLCKLSVTLYRPVPVAGLLRAHVSELHATRGTRHMTIDLSDGSSNHNANSSQKLFARAEALLLRRTEHPDSHLQHIEEIARAADADNPNFPSFPDNAYLDACAVRHPTKQPSLYSTMLYSFADGRSFAGFNDSHVKNISDPVTWYVRSQSDVGLFRDERTGCTKNLDMVDRALVYGDANSGASPVFPWGSYQFSNIDYTVTFYRVPDEPELSSPNSWICSQVRSRVNPTGSGLAVGHMHDRKGVFAITTQNLVIKKSKL